MEKRNTHLNEYTQVSNSLVRDVAPRIEDRITVEIGDTKQTEFIPQAKIMRWNNETNFSIRRDNGARSFIERDGKIVAEGKDENVIIYELDVDEQNEDGGLEIEIELPRRPSTNVFEFTLQTKGLNFYYQPALTAEEIEQGASQPENVIGSYAVYHATKRDNRVGGKHYKTGKAFHIYRPKAIDANGAEVWCELNIDEQTGVLTVTVPQQWLNRASYPVRIDPTFGYTSIGATQALQGAQAIYANMYQDPGEAGSISSFSVYTRKETANREFRAGIYVQNSTRANSALVSPQSDAVTVTSTSFSWLTSSVTGDLSIISQDYIMAMLVSGAASPNRIGYVYDTGGTATIVTSGYTYPSFPDPIGNGLGEFSRQYSIYATYTATPSFTPTPMMHMMAQTGGLM